MKQIVARGARLVLVGVAVYYAVWGGEYSVWDLRRIHERQEAERARTLLLRAEVDSLRAAAERLQSDPAAIETVARERFGMIREGELLYRFLVLDPPAAAPPPEAPPGAPPGP